jgi:predicted XRE-type DNA-binding protein
MSAIHNRNTATFGRLSDRFVSSSTDSAQKPLPMHTTDLLYEIHRLILVGELTQREIAAHLGVSRGTVSAVASGARSLVGREPRRTYSPLTPTTPPVRCGRCGYRVYLPCIICRVREHRERQQLLQLLAAAGRQAKDRRTPSLKVSLELKSAAS